jgi:exodeoxyribonuclease V alpha subunit
LPQSELNQKVTKLLSTEDHQPTESAIALIIKDMTLKDELITQSIRDSQAEKILLCYKPTFFHTEQNLAQLILKMITSARFSTVIWG